jgi:hypothetical protein
MENVLFKYKDIEFYGNEVWGLVLVTYEKEVNVMQVMLS